MKIAQKKEPKQAWRPGLGSEVGKCDLPKADFSQIPLQIQDIGISNSECPRFIFCNCPLCPLDANWQFHKHLPGEPVCRWLREVVKSGSDPILRRSLSEKSITKVVAVAKILISRKGPLKTRLMRASNQGSKAHTKPPLKRG